MDLGPRFSSHRLSPPVSSGNVTVLTVELMAANPESSASIAPGALGASASAPSASTSAANAATMDKTADKPGELPVFGGASRPTIRTIVIDPGHGGDDNGVKGPGGAVEKQVTLAIARRVKGVIEGRLGMRVLLTQEDNRIGADGRAAIANNNKADLFISLHANGSPRPTLRGATIFTLSLDRFGEDARRQSQADREVLQVFGGGTRDFSLVEWELAQAAHLDGSQAFASILDQKLQMTAGMPAVSLQRAPMRNLAGANMPAVLIELGYLSNAEEEKLLTSSAFQGNFAGVVTDAVSAFRDYLEQSPQAPAPPTP